MSRVSARLIAIFILATSAGCLGRCGEEAPPDDPVEPPAVVEPATPADPVLAALAALADRVPGLPAPIDGQVVAEREVFRRDALVLGNQAVDDKRMDVILGIGDLLSDAGEDASATAFLQRSVGLIKPAPGEKAHLLALADVKRVAGQALEGASLMERAIDIEPSEALDFIELSRMYVAAGRPGPARAAVTRGLRKHAGDPGLALQGLEVRLVGGDAAAVVAELPAEVPPALTTWHLRLRAEALLVQGDAAAAQGVAAEIATADESSPWGPLLTAAALARQGKDAATPLARASGLAATGRKHHDARVALPWAESMQPDGPVSPWPRVPQEETPPAPAAPVVLPH